MPQNVDDLVKLSTRMIQLASIYAEDGNIIEAVFVLRRTKEDLEAINDDEKLGTYT